MSSRRRSCSSSCVRARKSIAITDESMNVQSDRFTNTSRLAPAVARASLDGLRAAQVVLAVQRDERDSGQAEIHLDSRSCGGLGVL